MFTTFNASTVALNSRISFIYNGKPRDGKVVEVGANHTKVQTDDGVTKSFNYNLMVPTN